MNRTSYHIIIVLLAAVLLAGCSKEERRPADADSVGDRIVLKIASEGAAVSKAEQEGTGVENKVEYLDVFVFNDNDVSDYHYERVVPNGGKAVLGKPKSGFDPDAIYSIYLIANSTNPSKPLGEVTSLTDLRQVTETSVSGPSLAEINPEGESGRFLMSGSKTGEMLNNGSDKDKEISVDLARAAAKIEVILEEGMSDNGTPAADDDYLFRFAPKTTYNTFRLNNWQGTSYVLPDENAENAALPREKLLKSSPFSGNIKFGDVGADRRSITITTYSYSNNWASGGGIADKMTHLVVRVPYLPYNQQDKTYGDQPVVNNYYTIPISKDNLLKPNHLYRVRVILKGGGAENEGGETNLENIEYFVEEWEDLPVNIGGGADPHYLTLNRDDLALYNLDDDSTSIVFSSSSKVIVREGTLRAYYYNKYGEETDVSRDVLNSIKITPDGDLNGRLDIHSPVPENNLIRYIEFEVWNGDPECDPIPVKIEQYPQEYITYYFGWYSYRTDFGYHYENLNHIPRRMVAAEYSRTGNRDVWTYGTQADYSGWSGYYINGFFGSKVAEQPGNNGYGNKRTYDISWYWGSRPSEGIVETANPRMYHVQINSSAHPEFPYDETFEKAHPNVVYELGIPRKDSEGKVLRDSENNKLVSPSFMIASRLGFVSQSLTDDEDGYFKAASHCAEYVEVYYPRDVKGKRLMKDGKELPAVTLDDWRLPTKAELLIIMRYQGPEDQPTEAMDYLLNWGYYMSAEGPVFNPYYSTSRNNIAIRCVRDHYENKEIK